MAHLPNRTGEGGDLSRGIRLELDALRLARHEPGMREACRPLLHRALPYALFLAFPTDQTSRETYTHDLCDVSYAEMVYRNTHGIPEPLEPMNELLEDEFPCLSSIQYQTCPAPELPPLTTDSFTSMCAIWCSPRPMACTSARIIGETVVSATGRELSTGRVYPRPIVDFDSNVVGDSSGFVYVDTQVVTHVPGLHRVLEHQGNILLGGSNVVRLWDTRQSTELWRCTERNTGVWGSDGIIYCANGPAVTLWDVRSPKPVMKMVGNRQDIHRIHSRGDVIATGSRDSTCIFDRRSGYPLYRLPSLHPAARTRSLYVRGAVVHAAREDTVFTYSLIDGELLVATRTPFSRIVEMGPITDTTFAVICAGVPEEMDACTGKANVQSACELLSTMLGASD